MADLLRIPLERVDPEVLVSMLEEYASRDGTDYGARELSLDEKVSNLRRQLQSGDLAIAYDLASEQWDILTRTQLAQLEL